MKITSAEFLKSGTNKDHLLQEGLPEVLFCGRSNVGKSSLINAICNRKNLARTSQQPGKTQTLNFFLLNEKLILVDVPGYGFAKVSKKMQEEFGKMIDEYLDNRKELKCVYLLVDFRHEPTGDDKLMFDYLKYKNYPVVIIATKYDKVKKSQLQHQIKLIKNKLEIKDDTKIIVTSSETREGIVEILETFENFF